MRKLLDDLKGHKKQTSEIPCMKKGIVHFQVLKKYILSFSSVVVRKEAKKGKRFENMNYLVAMLQYFLTEKSLALHTEVLL